ncbi:hypothetical protein V8D89_003892 [Ganoderma adspersum]
MFHFVPRKVTQRARPALSAPDPPVPGFSSTTRSRALTPDEAPNQGTDAKKAKGKNKATDGPTDKDLAILLTLSLSDHALWSNVELRRVVSADDDGWIPLSFLVQHSAYLLHLDPIPPESVLVRTIRGHADDVLEVRMRVTAPSKDAWYGKDAFTSKDDGGGYEVRLKHTTDALARARNSARNEWEERTVYVENVPLAHRTVPGIHRFLSSLLPVPTPCSPPAGTGPPLPRRTRIQAITLPPHHLDRPGGAPPKWKGFALVTFASAADATRLATDWPWLPRRTTVPVSHDEHEIGTETETETKTTTEVQVDRKDVEVEALASEDAVKFGFRALPKARWDALKDEYLEHRQRLLDELARADADAERPPRRPHERQTHRGAQHAEPASAPTPTQTRTRTQSESDSEPESEPEPGPKSAEPLLGLSAPYPPGCLVFVRNVHPETNKTTLKALLGAHAPPAAAALDYVDYAKGMASCHVRTSTPAHARALVSALAARPLAQTHGLDVAGAGSVSAPSPSPSATHSLSDSNATPKRITAELVDGEREALYWHKVPEKVRREAVRRAIALASASASRADDGDGNAEMAGEEPGEEDIAKTQGKRPRKRRRKA